MDCLAREQRLEKKNVSSDDKVEDTDAAHTIAYLSHDDGKPVTNILNEILQTKFSDPRKEKIKVMGGTRKQNASSMNLLDNQEENDGGSSGTLIADGVAPSLKRRFWTAEEDALLIEYVQKNGEGNWNNLQKHYGLSRCRKSCHLRWTNHLRPNLKKGPFSQEEERRLVELHAQMGNKWAQMSAFLPGRTSYEIKNYWNARAKRLERAGLPLYPPNISVSDDVLMDNNYIDSSSDGMVQTDSFAIPGFNSGYNLLCVPESSSSSKCSQDFQSQSSNRFIGQSINQKPFLGTPYPTVVPSTLGNVFPMFDSFLKNETCYESNYAYGYINQCANLRSHALTTDCNNTIWSSNDSESWEEYIMSPLAATIESECFSFKRTGLLHDVVQECNTRCRKRSSTDKSLNSPSFINSVTSENNRNNRFNEDEAGALPFFDGYNALGSSDLGRMKKHMEEMLENTRPDALLDS